MTLDHDTIDADIIEALRADASAPVPGERRERVTARLVGAGITGLVSSVAGATHAAAVSGAAAAGTTASLGGTAGTLTLTGLTKSLLVGMGLGAATGLGLHVAFRPPAPTTPDGAVLTARVTAPASEPKPKSKPKSNPEPESETAPAPRPAPSPTESRMNPAPELPHAAAPEAAKSLAEQQALLDDARAALRRGDGYAALAAVRDHVARFPRTSFDEEREAVAIRALVLLGRRDDARARVAAFEQLHPTSLLARSLRVAVGVNAPRDSVTEAAPSNQTQGRE